MISMLCQKTNEGKITPGDKHLLQYLVLDGANSETLNTPKSKAETTSAYAPSSDHLSEKYSRLDSGFLKKYPKNEGIRPENSYI